MEKPDPNDRMDTDEDNYIESTNYQKDEYYWKNS